MHARIHTTSKLSREIGPRRALVKGMVDSLILYERITTTEAKAKVVAPYFEKLVTRAKRGNLADTRHIIAHTASPIAAQKLITELADGFADRNGGYTRIIKIGTRRGDNANMAVVELVLPKDFGKKVADKSAADKKTKANDKPASKAKAKPAKKEASAGKK